MQEQNPEALADAKVEVERRMFEEEKKRLEEYHKKERERLNSLSAQVGLEPGGPSLLWVDDALSTDETAT